MLAPKPAIMSFDEYMIWEAQQEELWELVDGRPVLRSDRWDRDPTTGMAGTTRAHNLIVANLLRSAGNRLAGGPCVALASHMKHRSSARSAHYPDASIDCGSTAPDALLPSEPRVVFEMLSRSNTPGQQMLLIADYQAIPTLQHMVFLEQTRPAAILWTRNPDGWRAEEISGSNAVIRLEAVGIELPLAELYAGVVQAA